MTHDDINAAIAYGRAVAKRYSGAYGGCMDVYVGQSGRAFTAFPMRAVAAARGLGDGALCMVRISDGVVLAQKAVLL